jgi:N-acetyl-alpha-D-muramate 1-phosphate uridylyltransferase
VRQVVILAGGLATRMRPRTLTLPKSLLEVADRPFIDWQLEAIARSGYEKVLLCIGHLGEQIESRVGNGARFGLDVMYSPDGPKLLGTAGAIRQALPRLEPEFLVTYGDSYLPFDYSLPLRDLVAHPEALGTMSVFLNEGRWDASNTRIQDDHVTSYAKSDTSAPYIDYGATALRREVIAELAPDTVVGLDSIQERLAKEGRMRAVVAEERFYEIGSEAGLLELDARCRRESRS